MQLAKLQGTKSQIEQAEKRRAHYLEIWQKHLEKVKARNPTDDHSQLIQDVFAYISQINSAQHWRKIPTGNTINPRIELLEIDENLWDLSYKCRIAWQELIR